MKVTADGQITIPAHIRERLGLTPDTEVEFRVEGDALYLRRADAEPAAEPPGPGEPYPGKGAKIVAQLRGKATSGLSTDDIMRIMRGEDRYP